MSSEALLSSIIPFAGSGIAGFFMGMFLRRVLRFLVIIIGSFLGAVFLVIQWMQSCQYIQGQVDWDRVGNDIMVRMQSLSARFEFAYFWNIGNSRNQWPRNWTVGRSSQIMRE